MMYCNFSIDYTENLVKSIDNVLDVIIAENENNIIVAIKTKPLFLKSEINATIKNIENILKPTTTKNIFVTRSMEVFCDIKNCNEENKSIDFDKIINKINR